MREPLKCLTSKPFTDYSLRERKAFFQQAKKVLDKLAVCLVVSE